MLFIPRLPPIAPPEGLDGWAQGATTVVKGVPLGSVHRNL